MKASNAYFQNRDCQYFPCHTGTPAESFNCLFCFCPLYFLEDCGGDHVLTRGVKDCSRCVKPHEPGGYERTLAALRAEIAKRRDNSDRADNSASAPSTSRIT